MKKLISRIEKWKYRIESFFINGWVLPHRKSNTEVYSQNNEERIITGFFGNNIGTFLDLGANDGFTFSNTRMLYEMGWFGVLVDASPSAFNKLWKEYKSEKRVQCLNYAIGDECKKIILHESGSLLHNGDVGLLSCIDFTEINRWQVKNVPMLDVEVDMIDFKTLMEYSRYKTFDFVSIDIEGMEEVVLPQIDFDLLETRMVCVEWGGLNRKFFNSCMKKYGFKIIHINRENILYARNHFTPNRK